MNKIQKKTQILFKHNNWYGKCLPFLDIALCSCNTDNFSSNNFSANILINMSLRLWSNHRFAISYGAFFESISIIKMFDSIVGATKNDTVEISDGSGKFEKKLGGAEMILLISVYY